MRTAAGQLEIMNMLMQMKALFQLLNLPSFPKTALTVASRCADLELQWWISLI